MTADLPGCDVRARHAPAPRHLERRPDAGADEQRRARRNARRSAGSSRSSSLAASPSSRSSSRPASSPQGRADDRHAGHHPSRGPSHDAPGHEHGDDAAGYYTRAPDRRRQGAGGPIDERWANRRKLDIIIVGTGLAGGSAAATLGEAGYNVKSFCYQDSPRRAHSIAAQGGINAAKNYQTTATVHRLFYDTVKGGDYRSRESNVYRLAEVSTNIIDQCVARASRSPASTAASSTTARSAASRCRARSTPRPDRAAAADRRLPGAWSARSRPDGPACSPATRCSS